MKNQMRKSGVFPGGSGTVPVRIVLHRHGKHEWATHYQNVDTGDYFWGNYFKSYIDALRDFHARVAKLERTEGRPKYMSGLSGRGGWTDYDYNEILLWLDNDEYLYNEKIRLFKKWANQGIKPLRVKSKAMIIVNKAVRHIGERFKNIDKQKAAKELAEEYELEYFNKNKNVSGLSSRRIPMYDRSIEKAISILENYGFGETMFGDPDSLTFRLFTDSANETKKILKRKLDKTGASYEIHINRGIGHRLDEIVVTLWK